MATAAPTLPPPLVIIETMTPVPTPAATYTPSATPPPFTIWPYTVEGLRQHHYEGGKITILDELEANEIFTRYLIEYPSDGLRITGILQAPVAGKAPFPVIVMNHGFFSRSVYLSGDGTDRAAEFLNRRGYLTISSDYRSWGDSDLGYSLFYSGLVIDVVNLLNAIPSIPQADPDRIGMWGHSMGGGVTMRALVVDPAQNPGRIKAAVLYSTVSADDADVIERWGMGCFGNVYEGERLFGCNSSDVIPDTLSADLVRAYRETAADKEMLEKIAAYYNLNYIEVPIQIHYGASDGDFIGGTPPEWSRKLQVALQEAGKDVEIYSYEGERHSFVGDEWFAFMERTSWFFDKFVK
ncbi:MAG: alpha/beta fold hydrolase [Anaerolineales bacterium]|nr:alpha/beta fold hydrolase [Anaerolineales bacterium]